ncbi:MAG: trehalose-phosphatase [Actinomycetota bacterium]
MNTIDAAIFDTDGVITQTAAVHFTAWKNVFDEFLSGHAVGAAAVEFTDADYRHHVDGIGRYDGVDAFLRSRGIELPWGDADDPPGDTTVCAVGNKKNAAFEDAVREHGVRAYITTRRFIEALHEQGVRTAVISASKNCEMVIRAAGMEDLFEVRVDGNDAAELGFPGKPAPDVFLQAARRLGVEPARAAVIEDAIKGVEAGRAGDFGLVIGLDRTRHAAPLAEYADIVVPDLADLAVAAAQGSTGASVERTIPARTRVADLPDATVDYDLTRQVSGKSVAVFSDYDGVLSPIVARPEDAVLGEGMRKALTALASTATVAVVSGRDLDDVAAMVDIDGLWYAGSHGWQVRSPDGTLHLPHSDAASVEPVLDTAEQQLSLLPEIAGVWVERKRYAIAVHYRAAADEVVDELRRRVTEVVNAHDELRMVAGKKVFELRPVVDWNKGTVVAWLLEKMGLASDTTLPMYLGDDVTDEDGFGAVRSLGVGIIASTDDRDTAAHLRVDDPAGVQTVLADLAARLAGDEA